MAAISIRPYDLADAAALVEAARESTGDIYPWMEWCHPGYSLDQARAWIASQIEQRGKGTVFDFAIVEDGARIVGGCGLNGINAVHRFANLGYWIRSSAAGQGYAVHAVRILTAWAFANTDLERLEIVVAVGNTRSERVAEKAGAQREGILRARVQYRGRPCDAVMFSIVRPPPSTGG